MPACYDYSLTNFLAPISVLPSFMYSTGMKPGVYAPQLNAKSKKYKSAAAADADEDDNLAFDVENRLGAVDFADGVYGVWCANRTPLANRMQSLVAGVSRPTLFPSLTPITFGIHLENNSLGSVIGGVAGPGEKILFVVPESNRKSFESYLQSLTAEHPGWRPVWHHLQSLYIWPTAQEIIAFQIRVVRMRCWDPSELVVIGPDCYHWGFTTVRLWHTVLWRAVY